MNIKEPKKPSHVLGNQIKCLKFSQCPLCYGCRSYSSSDLDCIKCTEDSKKNICNTTLHKSDLINNFITKTNIKFDEPIHFESNSKGESN